MILSKSRLRIETTLTFLVVILPLPAQDVTNVRFEMTRNKVVIQYDLDSEDDSSKYYISVFPSVDGGKTFGAKLKELDGDLRNVSEGKDKTIFWNFRKEYLEKDGDVTLELRTSKLLEIDYGGEEIDIIQVKASMTGRPITNIRYSKQNGQVVFVYDIDCSADSSESFVSVNPSFNGGKTFARRLLAIEGDFNRVECGKDRTIIWSVADEKDLLSQAGRYGYLDTTSGFLGALGTALSMTATEVEKKGSQAKKEISFELRAVKYERITTSKDTLVFVEVMPSFPGGEQEMFRYIFENIIYPPEAKKLGIQGRVVVSFVVTAEGKINNVAVVKGVHPLLDAEAVRVVSIMPDWSPGLMGETPVSVRFSIPVSFRFR